MAITFITIFFTSLIAYATVYGLPDLPNNINFIKVEGEVLGERVGSWFQYLFWAVGAFSLFAAALGIVDYTSRLAADVIKNSYAHSANESKVYAGLVWGLVLIGILVLLDPASISRSCSGHFSGGRRVHDVHLFRVVDLDQPQEPAWGAQGPWIPAGCADLGDRVVRNAVDTDLPRSDRQTVWRLSQPARMDLVTVRALRDRIR